MVVINKAGDDLSTRVSLNGITSGPPAQLWRYSAANLKASASDADAAIAGVLPPIR